MREVLLAHHVALQTPDLANSVAWYTDFFRGRTSWTTDAFSETTRKRLPGIVRMAEVVVGDFRFHMFERVGADHAGDRHVQFQHVCLRVDSPALLADQRARWFKLAETGRYVFLRDELPTEILVDDDGAQSFYCYDVNGLEFEFTFLETEN